MQKFGRSFSAGRSQGEMSPRHGDAFDAGTPQDVTSTRAKSQRHKKVTADKWNQ
jgi:hypothetical protein